MKIPWLAALLNFVLSGVGYLYNGKRVVFGVILLASEILTLTVGIGISESFLNQILTSYPMLILGTILMQIAFAVDAYQEAKSINQRNK